MYAVIFRATIDTADAAYTETAACLRERAMSDYGCVDFITLMQGDQEISISYWNDLDSITAWKHDAEHMVAQQLGRSQWYVSYRVQVVELIREYEMRNSIQGV